MAIAEQAGPEKVLLSLGAKVLSNKHIGLVTTSPGRSSPTGIQTPALSVGRTGYVYCLKWPVSEFLVAMLEPREMLADGKDALWAYQGDRPPE
jgi:hypothetical protein